MDLIARNRRIALAFNQSTFVRSSTACLFGLAIVASSSPVQGQIPTAPNAPAPIGRQLPPQAAEVRTPTPGSVDLQNSRVYVFVGKKGAGHEHGVEGRLSDGRVLLDRAEQAGELTFDMRTFVADTAAARRFFQFPGEIDAETQSQVNANLHGSAVLDVATFPAARFSINSVRPVAAEPGQVGRPYRFEGEFTLHGVRRPLQFVATAETTETRIRLRGRFQIKQTDYAIKPFSKFLGAVGVTDELQVYGDLYLYP